MANRLFTQFRYTLEKKMCDIYGRIAIGATGAPTLATTKSKGLASITRTGVGAYTVVLQDTYTDLFFAGFSLIVPSGANTVTGMNVVTASPSTKTYTILFVSSTGADVEIVSGATLLLKFELKDSSV